MMMSSMIMMMMTMLLMLLVMTHLTAYHWVVMYGYKVTGNLYAFEQLGSPLVYHPQHHHYHYYRQLQLMYSLLMLPLLRKDYCTELLPLLTVVMMMALRRSFHFLRH
jgi:hypothetical protein